MLRIDDLLANNEQFVAGGGPEPSESGNPRQRLAIVTCMDARIDVFAALGLHIGDAHVLRNAGGRLTDDVLRSLALSTHALGVNAVLVMQHTRCGLTGVTDEQLRELTGTELDFLAIEDHAASLGRDLDTLIGTPYLDGIEVFAGVVYDVDTGKITEVDRRTR